MAFEDRSAMSQKLEFVRLALSEEANVSELCRRFGLGRTSAYKLLHRYRTEGPDGLAERSRRPQSSPLRSMPEVEAAALAVRREHPSWGGRKIAKVLARQGEGAPAPSTVTGILRRNGVVLGAAGGGAKPFIRFEHPAPNDLWQMDFKGHVAMRAGRLHPLTVLDDHSRYAVVLAACADETADTVKAHLVCAFRRYGLPWRIATDNGAPWGDRADSRFTALTVWLIEAGVSVSHSRPYHPQTLGKDERFHRSLKAEVLAAPFEDLTHACQALEHWRGVYNAQRPHDALAGAVPMDRFALSPRPYRDILQPFEYAPGDIVRRVQRQGWVTLHGRPIRISKAFAGKAIAFRPTERNSVFDTYFRHQQISTVDLNQPAVQS